MNTFRYDEEQRRQWVQDKLQKRKPVKQICKEAQISRATLYNWIDESGGIQSKKSTTSTIAEKPVTEEEYKPLPVQFTATRHRMLLAALSKIDTDKSIAKKIAATLVKRFTLSIVQACEIAGIDEAAYGHKPRKPEVDDRQVQGAILELLATDPSKSFDQLSADLLKKYPAWTRKQLKRVYREGRLYLKRQRAKKTGTTETATPELSNLPVWPYRPGAIWNLGMANLENNWLLFIIDDADTILLNMKIFSTQPDSEKVDLFLNRALEDNGKPRRLRLPDNGMFHVKEITRWAFAHKLSLLALSMSKPENELEVQAMERSAKEQLLP